MAGMRSDTTTQPTPSILTSSDPAAALAAAIANAKSNSGQSTANDPPVYIGSYGKTPTGRVAGQDRMPIYRDENTVPRSQAQMEFYKWTDAQRNEWGDYLAKVGYIDAEDARDYATLRDAWLDVIDEGTRFTSAGKNLQPRQIASLMAQGGASKKKAGGFTGTKTQSSSSVDLSDPTTAKALVNNVLSQTLGREATPEDLNEFTKVLAAAERSNPQVTNTTGTYSNGDLTSTSSTTTGGVNRQQVIKDAAMQKPEYGAVQAATTYFQALQSALGPIASV